MQSKVEGVVLGKTPTRFRISRTRRRSDSSNAVKGASGVGPHIPNSANADFVPAIPERMV